jgi:hypothetical protein
MTAILANTGTVSFVLYGIFIVITITGMIVAFRMIIKGTVTDPKLDKLIELFKYSIVTVAIATVTLIISDLFKEREQDVKELEYFDKYVQDVKNVDGIKQRLQLSKYLSIVAPSGQMHDAWQRYWDSTKVEYQEYTKQMAEKQKLDTVAKPTAKQLLRKEQLVAAIAQKESPLATYSTNISTDFGTARDLETKGFDYLLKKDLANAINSFISSENAYNKYHQVYEIANYLTANKAKLGDSSSPFWKEAYFTIYTSFSFGMPEAVKAKMKELSQ